MKSTPETPPGVRRSRSTVQTDATLCLGADRFACAVLDLSVSGARLRRPDELELSSGTPLRLELGLADGGLCAVEARAARVTRDELALRFDHLGGQAEQQILQLIEQRGRLLDALDAQESSSSDR